MNETKIKILKEDKFSLVLSGGGALGIAHLGVLSDMQELELEPSEIIGTSMGGIIGACLAIGMREDEIYNRLQEFSSIFNWLKLSFKGNAVVDNSKLYNIFDKIFTDKKMSDTQIPLKIISTNLKTGKKRVFDFCDDIYIKDAILSTMAIPGIFKEHIIDDDIYGDGFLCENLGVSEASYHNILAIDVMGINSFETNMPDNFFKTSNVLEMFEKSMRFMIYNQSQTLISHSDKDIYLIEPVTKDYKTFQFDKYKEIRELGIGLL